MRIRGAAGEGLVLWLCMSVLILAAGACSEESVRVTAPPALPPRTLAEIADVVRDYGLAQNDVRCVPVDLLGAGDVVTVVIAVGSL